MKKTFIILAAALGLCASACIELDPETIDNTIAKIEAKDVDFNISVTYQAKSTHEFKDQYETVEYSDVDAIKGYFKNFRFKGDIEFKGFISSKCNSGMTVKVKVFGLDGVEGHDADLIINGKNEVTLGPNVNKEAMTLKFTSDYEFGYFKKIVFYVKATDTILAGDSVTFTTETFSAEEGISVII